MANPNVDLTLDDAVAEILGLLTGLDLSYSSQYDRYRAVARQLNRALRNNALEHEWSYYSSVENLGTAIPGAREVQLRGSHRLRIVSDDAIRLVAPGGNVVAWAYILPRDALHKYAQQPELKAAVTRGTITFSRPLGPQFKDCEIHVPVMREPRLFNLPDPPRNEDDVYDMEIPEEVRDQRIDFDYPDVVILRAAYQYAQTDPIMQPRVQTLEAQFKDLMYQLIERDDRHTDAPLQNDFFVPIQSGIHSSNYGWGYNHPHSDGRR